MGGGIRKVWMLGDRRDFFEVVEDLGLLIRGASIISSNQKLNPLRPTRDTQIKHKKRV